MVAHMAVAIFLLAEAQCQEECVFGGRKSRLVNWAAILTRAVENNKGSDLFCPRVYFGKSSPLLLWIRSDSLRRTAFQMEAGCGNAAKEIGPGGCHLNVEDIESVFVDPSHSLVPMDRVEVNCFRSLLTPTKQVGARLGVGLGRCMPTCSQQLAFHVLSPHSCLIVVFCLMLDICCKSNMASDLSLLCVSAHFE